MHPGKLPGDDDVDSGHVPDRHVSPPRPLRPAVAGLEVPLPVDGAVSGVDQGADHARARAILR